MFKRIGLIAVLAGVGQVVSLLAIKLSSNFLSIQEIASIAQIDTIIVVISSMIAAGLQSAAMRDIATEQDWQSRFKQIQSARFCFSVLLLGFGSFSLLRWEYLVFLLSPVIALNGDYALYALGKSVKAAFISCLRLIIPYGVLIVAIFFAKPFASEVFLFAWLVGYFATNRLIFNSLKIKMFCRPRFNHLKLYLQSLPLGIGIVCSNFLGIGLVLIIPYFYPSVIEATAFMGLKFHTIFKGVLRIIHQAFLKEMLEENMCLKVDQISMLIALAYLTSFIFFPAAIINIFFGERYVIEQVFFILLGFSAVIYSFWPSSSIKTLFERKDIPYAIVVSIAALVTIVGIVILSMIRTNISDIAAIILIGEIAMATGLFLISSSKNLLLPRFLFLLKNLPVFFIPLMFRFLFGDVFVGYIISFSTVSIILILINYRRFKTI